VSPGSGPLQSGPLQVTMTEPAPEGTGEYPSSALPGARVALGRGRQTPDRARDLAGWSSGELPGQVAGQLAPWPSGLPSAAAAGQRVTPPRSPRALQIHLISGFTAAS
jgi:hypothetical protein